MFQTSGKCKPCITSVFTVHPQTEMKKKDAKILYNQWQHKANWLIIVTKMFIRAT